MDIRKLQRAIVDGLEDVKAQDIVVFNTEHLSPLFERVVIASGTSNRQTKALAASVRDAVRQAGFQVMRTEGEDNGEWIIVDCAAAVVHVMQPAIRHYYQLEEIWGEKPVAIKLKGAAAGLVKASEPMDEDEGEAQQARPAKRRATAASEAALAGPTRKAAAKKAAPRKAAAADDDGRPAARKTARAPAAGSAGTKATAPRTAAAKTAGKAGAAKTAPRKAAAKKAAAPVPKVVVNAPARKAAAKKAPAKAPARQAAPGARKVDAKKVAAKKSPARTAAVKKVAAKKVAAKKAPARKTSR